MAYDLSCRAPLHELILIVIVRCVFCKFVVRRVETFLENQCTVTSTSTGQKDPRSPRKQERSQTARQTKETKTLMETSTLNQPPLFKQHRD